MIKELKPFSRHKVSILCDVGKESIPAKEGIVVCTYHSDYSLFMHRGSPYSSDRRRGYTGIKFR